MKNFKELDREYDKLLYDARLALTDLISKNLGKEVDPECETWLSYTKSFSGEDKDFHLKSIREDGSLNAIDSETYYDIEGLKINEIHLWSVIALIGLLEEL